MPPASALTGFLQGPEEHRSETLQEESQEETHRCKEPQAGRGAPSFPSPRLGLSALNPGSGVGPDVSLPRHPALQPSTAHLSQVGWGTFQELLSQAGQTLGASLGLSPCSLPAVVPIVDPRMGRMGDKGCRG